LNDVEFAPSATEAVAFLGNTYRGYWREGIGTLGQEQWWRSIGLLRDFYRREYLLENH
jgi:hypothetical protein